MYHIIYNYSLSKKLNKVQSKDLSKEQSKALKNCLLSQKYQLLWQGQQIREFKFSCKAQKLVYLGMMKMA
jgi:hypothetical protein